MVKNKALILSLISLSLFVFSPEHSFAAPEDFCENQYNENGEKILTEYELRLKYGISGGHTHYKDEGYWIYTSKFRRDFNMPCEWVDDDLKGAEGMLVWLKRTTRLRCHGEGDEKNCVPLRVWGIRLFFNEGTNLGIKNDYLFYNSRPQFSSLTELAKQHPRIKEKYDSLFDLGTVKLYAITDNEEKVNIHVEPHNYVRDYTPYHMTSVLLFVDDQLFLEYPHSKHLVEFYDQDQKLVTSVEIPPNLWKRAAQYQNDIAGVKKENWSGGQEVGDFLWIYTKEFAQKYSLPEEYISEDLEGASAMVFRISHYGVRECGFFGDNNPESCVDSTFNQLDIYIPKDADIQFTNDVMFWKNRFGMDSTIYMSSLRKVSYRTSEFFAKRESELKPVSYITRNKKKLFGFVPTGKYGRWGRGGVFQRGFYRNEVLNEGYNYIQFKAPLETTLGNDELTLIFTNQDGYENRFTPDELLKSSYHKIILPFSYRKKVQKYIEEYQAMHGSLWNLVEKRLK